MSAPPYADPGRGVFETMLVVAGRAVELDAHIRRLNASVEALYGLALPAQARSRLLVQASAIEHGKLRLTVIPGAGTSGAATTSNPHLTVEAEEIDPGAVFPGPERAASLRSHVIPGGLGEHKWADRDLLDRIATAAPGQLPLLLDTDGAVLEASRASVFVIRNGRLATPPTDGRILPSIARQQAIEVAAGEGIETAMERLTVDDLQSTEVFLTGSVRGIEPVRWLDEAELAPPGEISGRLAAGLRRRWMVPAGEPVAAVAAAPPDGPPGH
jgi:para-aminobenzoate synthetase/4-amino-4-deoxychorismate lyase